MKNKVKAYNKIHNLFQRGDRIVVGVSGGKDSVCLLHVLNEWKMEYELSLFVVHINHGIRGKAADEDAAFVEALANKYGLPCHVENIDVKDLARVKRISEEEAGRMARYDTMEMIRVQNGYDKIAIAHHQDDVAETVLFNLFRGTGPKGLSGIPPKRDYIIRPILFAQSEEIMDYIQENHLEYREDDTNHDTIYTRNKLRLDVFPYLEREINAKAKLHVAEAAQTIYMQNAYIEKQARREYLRVVKAETCEYYYHIEDFQKIESVIQVEVVRLILMNLVQNAKDIERSHFLMVLSLSDKEVGKKVDLPQRIVAERTYDSVRIYEKSVRVAEETEPYCLECQIPGKHIVMMGEERYRICLEKVSLRDSRSLLEQGKIPEKDYTKWFDYDKIKNDVLLRNPLEGDYISLNEEGKRKKLSRYFIDEKIPAGVRGEQLILADGSHVIWVLASGRISEEYKVTEKTRTLLVITKERV